MTEEKIAEAVRLLVAFREGNENFTGTTQSLDSLAQTIATENGWPLSFVTSKILIRANRVMGITQ